MLKAALPILVLAAGIGGAARLVATKPVVLPEPPVERTWLVATAPVEIASAQPSRTYFGEIVSGRTAEMRALVAGEVVEAGDGLISGGVVRSGDLIIAIDGFDYKADRDEAAAELTEAKAKLNEQEARVELELQALSQDREILALLAKEVDRKEQLNERGNVSLQSLEESKRNYITQRLQTANRLNTLTIERAKLEQQSSVVERAQVALLRAERDLSETLLIAPFDGFVVDPAAQVGQRLNVNDRVATLIDARRLEAKVQLPAAAFGRLTADRGLIGREARVTWRVGATEISYDAVVERISSELDPTTGSVQIFAGLVDLDPSTLLRSGAFVQVTIKDRRFDDVADLPSTALFGPDTVYVVVDGRLQARKVNVAARAGDRIFVSGELADGERVVTTRFKEIAPGLSVEMIGGEDEATTARREAGG